MPVAVAKIWSGRIPIKLAVTLSSDVARKRAAERGSTIEQLIEAYDDRERGRRMWSSGMTPTLIWAESGSDAVYEASPR